MHRNIYEGASYAKLCKVREMKLYQKFLAWKK